MAVSRFSQKDIRRMRRFREYGASLAEIANVFGTNEKAVHYYVRDIKPSRDGRDIEIIPLPKWVVRHLMKLREES